MRILVTGAAGFIGSHLVERLLADGDDVTGLDDFNDYYDPRLKHGNLAVALDHERFRLVEGDLLDRVMVERLLAADPFEVVVHLAARAGVRPSLEQPLLYQRVNVEGTALLLEAARSTGVRRFVFASSSSVYGEDSEPPFREDQAADRPISPYGASKRAGELLAHTYHHLYGLEAPCLRFFTVYGPRQRPDMAIHKFTRLIESGEAIPFFGDGSSRRDYTYIDDIIQGVLGAIRTPDLGFEVFNLGESETITLAGLVEALEQATGRRASLDRRPTMPGDVTRTCACIDRASTRLGYHPTTSIREGLPRFVAWYREHLGGV
jgi:UDP-glucuronate 4-epimerase